MKKDPKTTYAQSSDIKSRTYLQYRLDMKRKAIAELELMDWIEQIFQERYQQTQVFVSKSGGDKFLWFLRGGGISQDPDFTVRLGRKEQKVELQYSEVQREDYYDFKVGKVSRTIGKGSAKKRVPKQDVLFLYIVKSTLSYAILEANWIYENGQIGQVPAWRAQGYRVPAAKFQNILKHDDALDKPIRSTENKNAILEFQFALVQETRISLAEEIAKAIEGEKNFHISQHDLDALFRACFIIDALQEKPPQIDQWLELSVQHAQSAKLLKEVFQAVYCLDFLYFAIPPKEGLESLTDLCTAFTHLQNVVSQSYSNGFFQSEPQNDPCTETRYALFAVNCIEDMIQDILYYRGKEVQRLGIHLEPIRRIFQSLPDPDKIAEFIKNCPQRGQVYS